MLLQAIRIYAIIIGKFYKYRATVIKDDGQSSVLSPALSYLRESSVLRTGDHTLTCIGPRLF